MPKLQPKFWPYGGVPLTKFSILNLEREVVGLVTRFLFGEVVGFYVWETLNFKWSNAADFCRQNLTIKFPAQWRQRSLAHYHVMEALQNPTHIDKQSPWSTFEGFHAHSQHAKRRRLSLLSSIFKMSFLLYQKCSTSLSFSNFFGIFCSIITSAYMIFVSLIYKKIQNGTQKSFISNAEIKSMFFFAWWER